MRRSSGIAAALSCLLAAHCSDAPRAWGQASATPRRFAVLVGVEDYEHASLREPPLKYACDDVADLAQVLRGSNYEVTLLTDDSGAANPQLLPNRTNIQQAVRTTLENCRAADTVILAFAGHGLQFAGQPDAYFCPSDARPFPDRTDSLVSISGIYSELERSFAGVKIIFVDACRNDPTPGRGRGVDADSAPIPPRGVAALFSCSAGQRAFEHDDLKHGVFFHHVLEGFKGEAANRNGDITFQLLSNHVCTQVPGDVARLLANQRQFPNMKADLVGVPPILARVSPPPVSPPAVNPPGPVPAMDHPPSLAVEHEQTAAMNLKNLVMALHNYEAKNGHLPPAVILGKDGRGKVPHSWRVALLPDLNEQKLYDSYHFEEPWNSNHNRSLLGSMPAVYRSPLDDPKSVNTSCFAVTPPLSAAGEFLTKEPRQTAFGYSQGLQLQSVTDGLSLSAFLVEARRDIPWTKPEDLVLEAGKPLPALGGWFKAGFHVGLGDTSAQFYSHENPASAIRDLLEINNGTPLPELIPASVSMIPAPVGPAAPALPKPDNPTLAGAVAEKLGIRMQLIPAGKYLRGSPASESGRDNDEGPQHLVQMPRPFQLGATEITQIQFSALLGFNPSYHSPTGAGREMVPGRQTGNYPVEQVSWFDAIAFCNALSAQEQLPPFYELAQVRKAGDSITSATVRILAGSGYRLPTEAEWEYACRAETETPFHFGRDNNGEQANVIGWLSYGKEQGGPHLTIPASVGSYPPNPWGLLDMHGNVREWCQDGYSSQEYSRYEKEPASDPRGPDDVQPTRVLRGGSWGNAAADSRSANREFSDPGERMNFNGFRIARSP